MKNSWKNDPHKPKEHGLKLEETYPNEKNREKNKNELQKFPEQTSIARKDTPTQTTAGAKPNKNGFQNTQRKGESSSLALVGSVADGKSKFTTLARGKPAQPPRVNLKQKWSRTSENNLTEARGEKEKTRKTKSPGSAAA